MSSIQGQPVIQTRSAEINGTEQNAALFCNGSSRKFTGEVLFLTFSVPQFIFHVTTA